MLRGESFVQTAVRQCAKSGFKIRDSRCLGLYPVRFPSRHDITACVVAQWKSGKLVPTHELSKYTWFAASGIREIRLIGTNYRRCSKTGQGGGTEKSHDTEAPWERTVEKRLHCATNIYDLAENCEQDTMFRNVIEKTMTTLPQVPVS